MSSAEAQARERRGRRREIIERAAADVFAEHGYHGASIDEIARPLRGHGAGRLRPLRLEDRPAPPPARANPRRAAGDVDGRASRATSRRTSESRARSTPGPATSSCTPTSRGCSSSRRRATPRSRRSTARCATRRALPWERSWAGSPGPADIAGLGRPAVAADGRRGDPGGARRARDLVGGPPRGAARADRDDRGQLDLGRARACLEGRGLEAAQPEGWRAIWEALPMPSDRFFSRLSSSLPDPWLRRVGRLNVPVYRAHARTGDGPRRPDPRPAPDDDRAPVR